MGSGLAPPSHEPLADSSAKEAPSIPSAFASVPKKLADKILALDFIDMAELLPEHWRVEENREGGCCNVPKITKKKPLTDILLWLECYATLVAILTTVYPEKAAQFMAYQQTIIQASKNFSGEAWATYDLCYRRRAANLRMLDWGVVDQDLYSKSFTGRARSVARCKNCLSDTHASEDCGDAPVQAEGRKRDSYNSPGKDLCMLFNKPSGNVCKYSPCRFAHRCSRCQRSDHPTSECLRAGRERSPIGKKRQKK